MSEDNDFSNDADVFGEVFRCLLCKEELSSNIASRIKHQSECVSKNKIGKRKFAKLKKESLERKRKVNTQVQPKEISPSKLLNAETNILKVGNLDKKRIDSEDDNEPNKKPKLDIEIKHDPIILIGEENEIKKIDHRNGSEQKPFYSNENEIKLDGKFKNEDQHTISKITSDNHSKIDEGDIKISLSKTLDDSSLEDELTKLLKNYKDKLSALTAQYNEKKEALQKTYYMKIGKLTVEKEEKISFLKGQLKENSLIHEEPNIFKNDLLLNAFDSTVNIHWNGESDDFDPSFSISQGSQVENDSFLDSDENLSPVFPIGSQRKDDESDLSDTDGDKMIERFSVKIPHTNDIDKQLNDRVPRNFRSVQKDTSIEYIKHNESNEEIVDDHPQNKNLIKEVFHCIDDMLEPDMEDDIVVPDNSLKTSAIDDLLQRYEYKK